MQKMLERHLHDVAVNKRNEVSACLECCVPLGVSGCDLIAAFSMASAASTFGSSSARISSGVRWSIRIPLWSLTSAPAVTAVLRTFWDCEPGQFQCKQTRFPPLTRPSYSTHLMIITTEFPELNLKLSSGEVQWTHVQCGPVGGGCSPRPHWQLFREKLELVLVYNLSL